MFVYGIYIPNKHVCWAKRGPYLVHYYNYCFIIVNIDLNQKYCSKLKSNLILIISVKRG